MSLTLRKIRNTNFPCLYKKFLLGEALSQKELSNLLSIAIIMLNSDNSDIKKLGYRIIVIYSNRTNDYEPLYEISINQGLYPITKKIDNTVLDNNRRSFFTELNLSYLEIYKSNGIYYSEQQYKLNDFYSKKNHETISIIAPTSYGKSELIIKTLKDNQDKNICIITPTKSLLSQTRNRILGAGIAWIKKVIVHPEMYNTSDCSCVAVLTQERLFRLLKENPKLNFDCVIIDEAHELLDGSSREELLASVIVVLNKRNGDTAFKFLTPFISNEKNLKLRYSSYDLSPFRINEYVKTERFYLYVVGDNSGLQLYDQYINEWFSFADDENNHTSISFIKKHSSEKNIIYFNKPIDIESFACEMLNQIGDVCLSPDLQVAIDHISEYINHEYTLVKCLKKGIIYHHGSIPDTVRSYIEYLYKKYSEIKYVITSSTLLEGVNLPATTLFMMDNRKGAGNLTPSAFKNLVGRICRFNEVFNIESGSLKYLEPEVYFVVDKYYRKDANIKKFLSDIMKVDKEITDEVCNILLENTPITEGNKEKLVKAQEFIENYEPNTINNYNYRHAQTETGKTCILNNVTEIDVFSRENDLERVVVEYRSTHTKIETSADLIDAICNIFLPFTLDIYENSNFLRFNNQSAVNYYKMFLSWKLQSIPFNQMIAQTLAYWKKTISLREDTIVYVGRWGDLTRGNGFRKLWTDISKKNQSQLINLAIVRIKEEQDFIDNTIMKYVEVLNDLELIEYTLYLRLKYGTSVPAEIVLIKNGISLSLTQLLMEKYRDCLQINELTNTVKLSNNLVDRMNGNKENKILIYEAQTNVF